MLEEMTRKDFAEIIRNYLYLPADSVITNEHLDAVEKEAWRIVDEGKYLDSIAVEILQYVESGDVQKNDLTVVFRIFQYRDEKRGAVSVSAFSNISRVALYPASVGLDQNGGTIQ